MAWFRRSGLVVARRSHSRTALRHTYGRTMGSSSDWMNGMDPCPSDESNPDIDRLERFVTETPSRSRIGSRRLLSDVSATRTSQIP